VGKMVITSNALI